MKAETVSTAELAKLFLVTPKTIAQWTAGGICERTARGRYDLKKSIMGFARHMRELVEARGGEAAAGVQRERQALLRAQRERAEFQLAKERNAVKSEMEAEVRALVLFFRNCVLSIPTRLAASGAIDRTGFIPLRDAVDSILTEMAGGRSPSGKSFADFLAQDDARAPEATQEGRP